MRRPGSGASTRSRRDEVWEMKRQRFFAKQAGGAASQVPPINSMGARQPASQVAPSDSLARLVAEGYPRASAEPATSHQPYGERPSSGAGAGARRGMSGGAQNAGFDSRVASQWNSNVVQNVQYGQNQHDPSVRGPPVHTGGQRVTQAPGGGASIDLSWNPSQPSSASAHPPRLPGAPNYQGNPNYQVNGASYGQQAQQQQQQYDQPHRHSGRSMSPAVRGGSGGGAPWGRDDNVNARQPPSTRRDQPPFGVDNGPVSAPRNQSFGAGVRGNCAVAAGVAPGIGGRGRNAGHTPGGQSSFVFG